MMGSEIAHLVRDSLWRGRVAWLWVGACVLGAWTLVAMDAVHPRAGVAASLAGVFVLGPMASLASMLVREMRYFPITSRHVWVAAWVLSAIVPTVFVMALHAAGLGVGLAVGAPPPAVAPSLGFVALCAFAYGGALLPVGPLVGYTTHAATERRPRWLWASLATVMFFVYFGGLILPWAFRSVLPTSFADLGPMTAPLLGAGLAAACGVVAWTPQRFGGMTRPPAHTDPPGPSTPGVLTGHLPVVRTLDRITGVNRLRLPILVWTFAAALTGATGIAVYFTYFEPSRSLYESFAAVGLLPFSAAGLSPKVILGTALFAPFFAIGSNVAWSANLRHMRLLPLSAAETTRILLMTTTLLWAVVWVVLLGVHLLILGTLPSTLRPELFIYLAGLSALVEAVSRTGRKRGHPFSLAAVPVLVFVGFVEGFSWRLGLTAMFWAHAMVGSTALLVAGLLTYRSLTRSTSSSRVYQSTMPSLGAH